MFITFILIIALIISVLINTFYLFTLLKPKPIQSETLEATDLLKDILNGKALVEIHRVAPENFFLRRPR